MASVLSVTLMAVKSKFSIGRVIVWSSVNKFNAACNASEGFSSQLCVCVYLLQV